MTKEIEIPSGYEARIEGSKVIIEQKELEDERIREKLHEVICRSINDPNLPYEERVYISKSVLPYVAYLEKQKEQKPAEWSEEDVKMYAKVLFHFQTLTFPPSDDERHELMSWLKSLPERFNILPKQEWGEEDEKMMSDIIGVFDGRVSIYTLPVKQYANRLKSLSLRPSWKPSEEQVEALKYALGNGGKYDKEALESLLNDIEKL